MAPKVNKVKQVQAVPHSLQLKLARDNKLRTERTKERETRRVQNKERRSSWLKKAEAYETQYATEARKVVDETRKAKLAGGFFVPAEAKLILVTRIRGVTCLSPQVAQTLRLLRLRQLHNAALIRVNKATIEMLRKVEPYITYGYPSRAVVSDLIYKRGFAKVDGQRLPLTNNTVIEQQLGKFGITCIEDLIHEIVTVGPNFKPANSFLWPFKLHGPKGGYKCKRQSFHNNGDWGNREEFINDLMRTML